MMTNKNLSIYLHIPFCVKKCLYCDFLSAPANERVQEEYLSALRTEIRSAAPSLAAYRVSTVFIGGGTPSVIRPKQITALLDTIRECFRVEKNAEISMELNPATVSKEALQLYKNAGINRLSIGLQSADNKELRLLGRIHTYEQFLETYEAVRRAGFTNVNVDVMAALPGQSVEDYRATLLKLLSLRPLPEHISAYSLIVEEGTPFYEKYGEAAKQREKTGEKQPGLPSEEEEREMYSMTGELLKTAGYSRYEISNYARAGYACRHNRVYWTYGEYAGFGLGAASFVKGERLQNPSRMEDYMQMAAEHFAVRPQVQAADREEAMAEFCFLGLRMMTGISEKKFKRLFGRRLLEVYGEVIEKNRREGLLSFEDGRLFLTDKGIDVSNYVMAQFLPN